MTILDETQRAPAAAVEEKEIELSVLWQGIRRYLAWIVLASAVTAAAIWYLSSQQPPVYEARSSLLVTGAAAQPTDNLLGNALVKAPPLPQGAVEEALYGSIIMQPLIEQIRANPKIPLATRIKLAEDLSREASEQDFTTIQLNSRIEQYSSGSGIYTLTAKAGDPDAAAVLANMTAEALLKWDKERALTNVRLAQQGFEAQLKSLEQQLGAENLSDLERDTLISRRADLLDNLTQVNILEQSTTGVLSLLSPAAARLEPVAPKPLRNAVLAGLLVGLLGLGTAALITVSDRRVRSEDDLAELGLPTLTTLSAVSRREILLNGIVKASRQAGMYEAIGFLRVNLMSLLGKYANPVVMITSSAPGEGKSSVTAALADGLASSGRRVLIVDADLRRGTQHAVWQKGAAENMLALQLIGDGGARTTQTALENPHNVVVLRVADNVDLLPAGSGTHDSLSNLSRGEFHTAIQLWRSSYDVVLIDSPPLLALADGLVVGSAADGVILVVEYGRTDVRSIRAALRRADRSGLKMLGFVLNKANNRELDKYSYQYSYTDAKKK